MFVAVMSLFWIWAAMSIASDAFSTAVTAWLGSEIVPVARPWAAVEAACWL